MSFLKLLALLLFLLPVIHGGRGVPRFRVNLDMDPLHRWDQIIDAYKEFLPGVIEESKKYIPEHLQPFVWYVTKYLDTYFPPEYKKELEGIALASELPLGEIVGLNMLYDITAFDRKHILGIGCTSILARNEEGQIFHGRNLDYEMTELLKNITVYVEFHRSGKFQYSAITFPLYNGILTGQNRMFSVSLNARFDGPLIENILMELFLRFKRPVSYYLRQVLESTQSYKMALKKLSEAHLFSPSYIVLGGINRTEGAIISRNRWRAADVQTLDENQWFLVETNYDNWKTQGDDRRVEAIKHLERIGMSNMTEVNMMWVLGTVPVKNDLTIFTCVLSAADPRMPSRNTFIWDRTPKREARRLYFSAIGETDPLYPDD